MKAQYDEIQSVMKDIKEANSAAPTKLIVKDVETSTDDIKNVSTSVTSLCESKDASTFVEDIASTSSSTEIRTRRSPASSNLSECPTSSSTRPPPKGLPGTLFNPKKDILLGKSTCRTLFLTDSILSHINVNSYKTNQNETCVKKTMYYVTDFSNFEPEFGYSDNIVIWAGINDLTRKHLTPEQICDVILPRLRKFRALYPNSKFIINSVILTSDRQINRYIFDLNKYLIEGINRLQNVYFLVPIACLIAYTAISIFIFDRGIGIHIASYAVEYIKTHLVKCLRSRIVSSFFFKRNRSFDSSG